MNTLHGQTHAGSLRRSWEGGAKKGPAPRAGGRLVRTAGDLELAPGERPRGEREEGQSENRDARTLWAPVVFCFQSFCEQIFHRDRL